MSVEQVGPGGVSNSYGVRVTNVKQEYDNEKAYKEVFIPEGTAPLTATVSSSGGLGSVPLKPGSAGLSLSYFATGIPFVVPPGDGGATGLTFTAGGGGSFTTTSILASVGSLLGACYLYLPANAGGSGNVEGWYYAEFSTSLAGVVYSNRYTGGRPEIPTVKIPFAGNPSGRITQTADEITLYSATIPGGAMGKNGFMEFLMPFVSTTTNTKYARINFGGVKIWELVATTNPVVDTYVAINNQGRFDAQRCTRSGSSVTAIANSIVGMAYRIDTSITQPLSVSVQLTSNTDGAAVSSFLSRVTYFE